MTLTGRACQRRCQSGRLAAGSGADVLAAVKRIESIVTVEREEKTAPDTSARLTARQPRQRQIPADPTAVCRKASVSEAAIMPAFEVDHRASRALQGPDPRWKNSHPVRERANKR